MQFRGLLPGVIGLYQPTFPHHHYPDSWEDLNWCNAKTFGLRQVISLVEEVQGTLELDTNAGIAITVRVIGKKFGG